MANDSTVRECRIAWIQKNRNRRDVCFGDLKAAAGLTVYRGPPKFRRRSLCPIQTGAGTLDAAEPRRCN